jgi:hypothetical protein
MTSINDYCILQAGHHALARMEFAPLFDACDVFPMSDEINDSSIILVTEPTTHPGREVIRLRRRHSDILATGYFAHIDSQLRVRTDWDNRNRKGQADQSTFHCRHPFHLKAGARFLSEYQWSFNIKVNSADLYTIG